MSLVVIYLILSVNTFGNSYIQIVKNITAANTCNVKFKEDLDYTMYQIIIGSMNVEIGDDEEMLTVNPNVRNPSKMIKEARETFEKLSLTSTGDGSQGRIRRVLIGLNTIEKHVNTILETSAESGHYDENMELWDKSVCALTQLLQENVQEYIYYEAKNIEATRLQLEEEQKNVVRISTILFGALVIGTAGLSITISNSVSKPITNLCQTTDQVSKGDFSIRADISSGDEVATLAGSFNSMIEKIGELVEDIKIEQLNLRATELKLLQAQINPHFLYNTLDTIIWLAEDKQTAQVVSMVSSLSDFFRTTLSDGRDYITLREEEAHIRSYLEIQQFRYRDILDYEIHIPEELYQYKVLKLTLQPLVENALYHGIKNKRGMGHIYVDAKVENHILTLAVEDNGIGMEKEALYALRKRVKKETVADKKGGFGLSNVDERIRLNYGAGYGLFFESIYGEGTTVTAVFPAICYGQEQL